MEQRHNTGMGTHDGDLVFIERDGRCFMEINSHGGMHREIPRPLFDALVAEFALEIEAERQLQERWRRRLNEPQPRGFLAAEIKDVFEGNFFDMRPITQVIEELDVRPSTYLGLISDEDGISERLIGFRLAHHQKAYEDGKP